MTSHDANFEDRLRQRLSEAADAAPAGPEKARVLNAIAPRSGKRVWARIAAGLVVLLAIAAMSYAAARDYAARKGGIGEYVAFAGEGRWSVAEQRGVYDDGYVVVQIEADESDATDIGRFFGDMPLAGYRYSGNGEAVLPPEPEEDPSGSSFSRMTITPGLIPSGVSGTFAQPGPSPTRAPVGHLGLGGSSGGGGARLGRLSDATRSAIPHWNSYAENRNLPGNKELNERRSKSDSGVTLGHELWALEAERGRGRDGKGKVTAGGEVLSVDFEDGDSNSDSNEEATNAIEPDRRAQLCAEVWAHDMNRIHNAASGELWAAPVIAGDGVYRAFVFPLKHTDVNVAISGYVASTAVSQTFHNPSADAIEAIYVFPLPEDSAVNDYVMTVGERRIYGTIRRRAEARQIYEEAKSQGYTAALLEQERPNVFTQNVANIAPGEDVKVDLTFFNRLKWTGGEYEYVFPMVVAPRYTQGGLGSFSGASYGEPEESSQGAENPSAPIVPRGTRCGYDIAIEGVIDAGVPIRGISSPTHTVEYVRESDQRMIFRLEAADSVPNRDFVLRYSITGTTLQTGVMAHTGEAGGVVSLMFVPPGMPGAADISPREITFVLDVSGSMEGVPLNLSKRIVEMTLDRIRPQDSFNIFFFAGSNGQLFDLPQAPTSDNIAAAKTYLANMNAGGGTEMMAGLQRLFASPKDPGRLRMVVFLTDGAVSEDEAIVKACKEQSVDSRFFAFGIGSSVNRELIEGVGKHGRGYARIVLPREWNAEQQVVDEFYSRIDAPVLTDISIDWGTLGVSDQYPARVPDAFAGHAISVVGRYAQGGSGTITVHGNLGGRPASYTINVDLPVRDEANAALAPIWARAKIDELIEARMSTSDQERVKAINEEITQVALDWKLVSENTSFVAVDDSRVIGNGKPLRALVPSEMPEDMNREGVFGEEAAPEGASEGDR